MQTENSGNGGCYCTVCCEERGLAGFWIIKAIGFFVGRNEPLGPSLFAETRCSIDSRSEFSWETEWFSWEETGQLGLTRLRFIGPGILSFLRLGSECFIKTFDMAAIWVVFQVKFWFPVGAPALSNNLRHLEAGLQISDKFFLDCLKPGGIASPHYRFKTYLQQE